MRRLPILALLMTATLATAADRAVLEQRLEAKYKLSSVNAEGDFVLKGTTLVLRKSGLTGGADPVTCIHDYKDDKISLAGVSKGVCTGAVRTLSKIPGINLIPGVGGVNQTAQGNAPTTRPFVAGEKLYMSKIEVVKDDINLTLISELISMVRYRAEIRFRKAATLEVPEAENVIAEVLGIGAAGGGGGSGGGAASGASASPAAAPVTQYSAPAAAPVASVAPAATAMAPIPPPVAPPADASLPPIAPPPPPPDQPAGAVAVSPGMTIDQVVAMLGQPNQIADLGSKKIYTYPSQKVTFINGKVTPIEDSATNQPSSIPDVLLYEVGIGVVIIGAAAFLFLRRPKAVAMAPSAPPPPQYAMPAVPPPMPPMSQPPPQPPSHTGGGVGRGSTRVSTLTVSSATTPSGSAAASVPGSAAGLLISASAFVLSVSSLADESHQAPG